jgi:1-acyl-sn-glycerol-3-phosphate acyltransferase
VPGIEPVYQLPWQNQLSRTVLRPVFRGLFHLLASIKVQGAENIPYRKPYIAAINHISTFDPPFALAFWSENIEALGASDIWERKGFGQNLLVRLYGAMPVHRGEYDREAMNRVVRVLKSGYPLLMAPEGGRTHVTAMRQARPGLAFLVELADVPVVPVGIFGTTDDFFQKAIRGARPTLEMKIGRPITLPPVKGRGEERRLARQRNTDLIMAHIAGLLPPAYRGFYTATAVEPE